MKLYIFFLVIFIINAILALTITHNYSAAMAWGSAAFTCGILILERLEKNGRY